MKRDWTDAVAAHTEGRCRVCGDDWRRHPGRRLELAHLLGRKWDRPLLPPRAATLYVHPDSVVMLCGPSTDRRACHGRFDGHELDIRAFLTPAQIEWAINRLGYGQAMRALGGRNWS